MQDRLEALADAMMKLNGWDDPISRCYQLRNPLLLRAFSLSRLQEQDAEGLRIFPSFAAGYRAGVHDLRIKLQGESRARLSRDATLQQLLQVYHLGHPIAVKRVVRFVSQALACSDGSIGPEMPMSWFLQTCVTGAVKAELLPGECVHG